MLTLLSQVGGRWIDVLRTAEKHKWELFGASAEECLRFFAAPNHDFMYELPGVTADDQLGPTGPLNANAIANGAGPVSGRWFKAHSNLVSNVVQVFLPVLAHKEPIRTTEPRKTQIDPQLMARLQQFMAGPPPAGPPQMGGMPPPGMAPPGMQPPAMPPQQTQPQPQQQPPPGGVPQPGMPPPAAPGPPPAPPQPTLPPMTPGEFKAALRAELARVYLNFTPRALDLKGESRPGITECLIKGLGILWVEIFGYGPARKLAGLSHVSCDDLLVDPDAKTLRQAQWIARRRRRPVYEVESEFGREPGSLKGVAESINQTADLNALPADARIAERVTGETSDIIVYYEIWSRMGMGSHLKNPITEALADEDPEASLLDQLGDFVFLAVSPAHPESPLNINPEWFEGELLPPEEILQRLAEAVSWPVPFHEHPIHPWPFAPLTFHQVPNQVWPQAHVAPVLSYQKAINWIDSFLMGRIKITSRSFMVVPQGLDDDVKEAILGDEDLTMLEIGSKIPQTMQQICSFLNHPEVNKDVWAIRASFQKAFEDGTGVTELNTGGEPRTQIRSAEEANFRRDILNVRPDDMANLCEDWWALAAELEMAAAAHLLGPEDVAPIFNEEFNQAVPGPNGQTYPQIGPLTQQWMDLIHGMSAWELLSCLDFSIEEGSGRKPNLDKQLADVDQAMSTFMPMLTSAYQQNGDPGVINYLWNEWCRVRQFKGTPPQIPDNRAQIAAQQYAAAQEQALKSNMELMKHQVQQEALAGERQHELGMNQLQAHTSAQGHAADIGQGEELHQQGLRQAAQKHAQDMSQSSARAALQQAIDAAKATQQIETAKALAATKTTNGSSK